MKEKYDQVMQGASFKGLPLAIGIFLIVFSLVSFALVLMFLPKILILFSIILFLTGITLMMTIVILEVDTINKRYRETIYLIFFKQYRKWISLKSYDKIVLKPDRESLLFQSNFFINRATKFGYEIYFVDSINNRELFFYRSVDIPKAQTLLKEYAKKLDLEMLDEIQEGWKHYKAKRKHHNLRQMDVIK